MEQRTLNQLTDLISDAEYMKSCYFWNPPSRARLRRDYEKRHSHPEITWTDGKDTYTAEFTVSCSCRNIYAQGTYTRNGRKTTLTAIRNSYKRLIARKEEYGTCNII